MSSAWCGSNSVAICGMGSLKIPVSPCEGYNLLICSVQVHFVNISDLTHALGLPLLVKKRFPRLEF